MRICILTQPLRYNYGCLLQAFALQKALRDMGHEAVTEANDYKHNRGFSIRRNGRLFLNFMLKLIGLKGKKTAWIPKKVERMIERNTNAFVQSNIVTTSILSSQSVKKYDALVVGSDQVWRPKYSPSIYHYFLDFAKDLRIRRLSYAASFGVDVCEYGPTDLDICSTLLKKFDGVSVREESGAYLCREKFGKDAEVVLDPTMLLKKEIYLNLIDKKNLPKKEFEIFGYVFDKTEEKRQGLRRLSVNLKMKYMDFLPKSYNEVEPENVSECVYPHVEEWLQGITQAKYVVTDSFHCVVFSILFNKTFLALINTDRGGARIKSLAKMFGLEERVATSLDDLTKEKMLRPIDWDYANEVLEAERKRSFAFLHKHLG